MKMKCTTVWLTAAEVKSLKALSKSTGLTVADLIRRAIDAYVETKHAEPVRQTPAQR